MDKVIFQELLDDLGFKINQITSDGEFNPDGNIPQQVVYRELNKGIGKVAQILFELNENYYLDKFETHSEAGRMEYVMPQNLRNPKMVFVDYGGSGTDQKRCTSINPQHFKDINDLATAFDQETPRYYLRGWRVIGIIPTPLITTTGGDEKPIKIWGTRFPEVINSASSEVLIPREAIELVTLYAGNKLLENKFIESYKQEKTDFINVFQPRDGDIGEIGKEDQIWDTSLQSYDE